jgi:DNA-binding GntR family transcriptional regulator
MNKPTEDRERELLEAIVAGQEKNGYAPTRRELAGTIGISITRVQQLVDSCTAKGLLSHPPRAARAYVVHAPVLRKQEGRR